MKRQKLKGWMRALIALGGVMLGAAIFLPIWRIELSAPQYPEGLVLRIYANKLGGNVEIVNGLNHYIGMRTLHAEDFPEFKVLPYILGFFAVASLTVAIAGSRKLLMGLLVMYVLFAVLAMADFWKWEYDYGHNLDPTAPIQVPGMTYQPPLIGFKQLLNFGAYSIPDIGGWLMAAAGSIFALCTFMAWKKGRKLSAHVVLIVAVLLLHSSCSIGPVPIKVGKDNCDFCRMSVADARFGAEVLNKKGKAWKFDDIHCLTEFLKKGILREEDIRDVYFTRFDGANELLPSAQALLLHSEVLHSPMGSNIAAFGDRMGLEAAKQKLIGKEVGWQALKP